MNKKYKNIEELYDKFQDFLITRTTYNFQMGGSVCLGGLNFFILTTTIRSVKHKNIEPLFIDIFLDSTEWFFLRRGELILIIDNKRINLEFEEVSSNTYGFVYNGITENVYCIITKKILKSICDSRDLAMCIKGKKFSYEVKEPELENFKVLCRQFYNNFYDQSLYIESTEINLTNIQNDKKCFIATAVLDDINHPVLVDLRFFRDNWLRKRQWGIKFINWYYKFGPHFARIISKSEFLRKITYFIFIKPLHILTKSL